MSGHTSNPAREAQGFGMGISFHVGRFFFTLDGLGLYTGLRGGREIAWTPLHGWVLD